MTDLFKSKENEFYIELSEERYYFPGEIVSGDVVLDLKKATKTNNIKVILEGTVEIGGRSITLFSKSTLVAESPEGDQRSHYLEPHTHRFPFKMGIPSSKDCKVPSTLEIAKLLKVSYRLTAIYNKPFTVLEKFCPTTFTSINVLEDINVESPEFAGEQRIGKELLLSGETTRKVKVSAVVGKRAAVKGDVIPISITIQHIGVIVRDKALSFQLLRSVYYGKNKNELFGPKVLREVTSNIEISGPLSFTKTFDMQLPIPSNLCPSVDRSGQAFKIEYSLRVSVNLNEQNPLHAETAGDVVIFNFPFTIGTYPKLSFSIDDDDDDDEEGHDPLSIKEDSINSSEYDQVAEKMKDLDLSSEVGSPQLIQQEPPSLTHKNTVTHIDPTLPSPKQTTEPVVNKPNEISENYQVEVLSPPIGKIPDTLTTTTHHHLSTPKMENATSSGGSPKPSNNINNDTEPRPPTVLDDSATNNTAPLEHTSSSLDYKSPLKINPSEIYNDYQPGLSPTSPSSVQRHDSIASMHSLHSTVTSLNGGGSLGRQESFRWVVRNQDAPVPSPAPTPALAPSPCPAPQPTPPIRFAMPTPSFSESTVHGYPPPSQNHSMPVPQPAPPFPMTDHPYPHVGSYPSSYPYTATPPPPPPPFPPSGYQSFPTPQPHFPDNRFGRMPPSYPNYQPQPQYPFYNN